MSSGADDLRLRLQVQRTRGAAERAELRLMVDDMREAVRPARELGAAATRLYSAVAEQRGLKGLPWLRSTLRLVRERPWLLSAAVSLLGRRRSRRWLVVGAATLGAVLFGRMLANRGGSSGAGKGSPARHTTDLY
jgi:hypothetical protein